jgi:hypothetical protein
VAIQAIKGIFAQCNQTLIKHWRTHTEPNRDHLKKNCKDVLNLSAVNKLAKNSEGFHLTYLGILLSLSTHSFSVQTTAFSVLGFYNTHILSAHMYSSTPNFYKYAL